MSRYVVARGFNLVAGEPHCGWHEYEHVVAQRLEALTCEGSRVWPTAPPPYAFVVIDTEDAWHRGER